MEEQPNQVSLRDYSLIIFPAYNIGDSELFYFLKSLADADLLDKLLLICPESNVTMVQQLNVKYYILDNFNSFSQLVEKIDALKESEALHFTSIIGIDEEMQFQITKGIADHLGLPFYDDNTCLTGANKYLLKSSFLNHDVPTSRFRLITEPDEESIDTVGFPNVLKLMSGTQSHYVFVNKNKDQLVQNFNFLKGVVNESSQDPRLRPFRLDIDGQTVSLDPRKQFLLEGYAPGEEFSCDFILQQNELRIIRVVKKEKSPYFGLFKGYHLLTEQELPRECIDKAKLEKVCAGIGRSLSIETGLCMVDFKVHQEQIMVLEASIRPGFSAFNHLMYEIYGYTSLALFFMQQLGLPVKVSLPERSGTVIYRYGSKEEHDMREQHFPVDKLNPAVEIISSYWYKEDDDDDCFNTGRSDSLPDLKGYVLIRNNDTERLPDLKPWFDGVAGFESRG